MRITKALPLAAVLVALASGPVGAQTWSAPDRPGDVHATRIDLGGKLCAPPKQHRQPQDKRHDITALTVDHSIDTVTVSVALRDVARNDRSTSYDLHLRTPEHAYEVDVTSPPKGEDGPLAFFSFEPHYPDPSDIKNCAFGIGVAGLPCDDLEVAPDPATDVLTISIPRSCLSDPAWVRVGCRVYGFKDHGPGKPFTSFADTWAPPGVKSGFFLPPFGPRVRAD